ncbi:type II restriction endonuclease subunit M [Rhodococcus sp. MH15]|uniref:Eco57I restriction-modification methylase domain-containing protein n=1 Tax=Rhodococcus sp. MH15 TaxID=1761014 RepID=UPI001C4FB8C6|nr:DNA methyltransferase [Rhodococcus sp. MH15]MBW0292813.1 type II restriction endonuclease subunit M [Rhodococcus sp. MH15]
MARQTRRHTPTTNAADLHRGWLELVDAEGPFLAIPPLKRVWPNGIPDFKKTHPDRFDVLVDARKRFESAWEDLDRHPDSETTLDSYRAARDVWVETVLRDIAGWAESLLWGEVPGVQAQSPNRTVVVTSQAALQGADGTGALVHVVDPVNSLRQTPGDFWAATPVDRIEALLRENKSEIGIVTDGRWWGLVFAREGSMSASGIVDALTWVEEPRTRDAFLTLIGRQHIMGGEPSERLPVLFEESVTAAEEVTEALGGQVRSAVELLIQSFSESAADSSRKGLPDPLPTRTHETYEAAVTVMMRVVFLLFAEERNLLPTGELFEQGYGISRELARLVARESEESEEALDATSLTWHRLLATSAALYSGASFESMRMPAYGGSLFDPARFPFLTDTNKQGTLSVIVSDRVMLHVLRSVQLAILKGGEARQISFRDVDVEQIGYIYEGLLGYTCTTVDEVHVGLLGKTGAEPEIPLSMLESLAEINPDPKNLMTAIRGWAGEDQPSAIPPSAAAMAKAFTSTLDPSVISALTQAVGDDHELRERVRPWLGIVRLDLRKHPVVVLAGGLLVKETPSRKNAGAHYTPKSLAEEVVLHSLQPLCYSPGPHQTAEESAWNLRSSDELLDLKIVDIACGSGAFLVAAARYLTDRVVEAWINEDSANGQRNDLYVRAIRSVVANCLYGADINDMAVEMCKLSLWLVSLDRDLPFSFVDDKIFVGNSLLGLTSLDQLRKLHIDPSHVSQQQMFEIFDVDIDSITRRAVELRQRLATEIDEDNPAQNSAAKRRQLTQLHVVTADLRKIADGIVAAGLRLGGKPGKALEESYENLRIAVKAAHPQSGTPDSSLLSALVDSGLTPTVVTDYERWQPLHWVLEVPDVLIDREGFDVVIGNPPFLGFKKITPAVGANVREWYANILGGGTVANADLVAFFFNRAFHLLARSGVMGLVATNTIAEGDTRAAGLDRLVEAGLIINRSVKSEPWPSFSANLQYAVVWGGRAVADSAARIADGEEVERISTLLEAAGKYAHLPKRIATNRGLGFQGCIPLGAGFILDSQEAITWLQSEPHYKDVIFPYINGDDLSSRSDVSPSRWVINFGTRTESEASNYQLPFARVKERVKSERAKNSVKKRREIWWQFTGLALDLTRAITGMTEVLAIARVSKAVMPLRVSTSQVFSNTLYIFATDSYSIQAVLSSSLHQLWSITYGATMGSRISYTVSDVFETFPLPQMNDDLNAIGAKLDTYRRTLMLDRDLGVTQVYNLVNDPRVTEKSDPEIGRLRTIHTELDQVVMDAYGWSDICLEHGIHTHRQVERWTVSPAARVKILDRLLEENHRRTAADEGDSKGSTRSRKAKHVPEGQGTLL